MNARNKLNLASSKEKIIADNEDKRRTNNDMSIASYFNNSSLIRESSIESESDEFSRARKMSINRSKLPTTRRHGRGFLRVTAITIALSLVIICLTSQALGQNDNDNSLNGGGRSAVGRARIARLKRLRVRTGSESTTTSAPVRERTRVRVKAIKSRKQKVNADRSRATLAQSNKNSGSSSSSDDTSNSAESKKDAGNNGMSLVLYNFILSRFAQRKYEKSFFDIMR